MDREAIQKQMQNVEVTLRGRQAQAAALAQELEKVKVRCAELRGALEAFKQILGKEAPAQEVPPVGGESVQDVKPTVIAAG